MKKKQSKFSEDVEEQLMVIANDPHLSWATMVGIPGLACLLCSVMGAYFLYIEWWWPGGISLFFALNLGYKYYIGKRKMMLRIPR